MKWALWEPQPRGYLRDTHKGVGSGGQAGSVGTVTEGPRRVRPGAHSFWTRLFLGLGLKEGGFHLIETGLRALQAEEPAQALARGGEVASLLKEQPVEGTAFNSLGRQVGTRRALTGKLVLEPSKPELERLKSPACDSGHPGLPSPPPAPCPRKLRGSVWNCWRLEPGRRAQADFHVASSGPLFPGGTSDGITKPQPRPGPREATGAVAHVSGALRARLWCRQVPGCSQPHLALGRGPGVVGAGVLQELAGSEGEASGLWRETDIQPPWWKMCLPLLFLFLTPPRAGLFGANDPAGPHPRRWLPHLESPGPS